MDLATKAARLRELHVAGDPLVLCNVWDTASARIVEAAGAGAIATTSAGVVESLGGEDTDSMDASDVFATVARIAAAVQVPVTADLEAGYQLGAHEFVERLHAAGAVGCNLEDSDHHGDGVLLDVGAQADRIASVKQAARDAGVDIVVNARVDTFARRVDDARGEALRRARRYVDAGADCVYPITASDEADIAALVDGIGAPVNALLRAGTPSLDRLRELGVARVSIGSGLFRRLQREARRVATALLAGDAAPLLNP